MAERLQFSMRALLLAVVMLSLPVAVLTREPTALSAAAAIKKNAATTNIGPKKRLAVLISFAAASTLQWGNVKSDV